MTSGARTISRVTGGAIVLPGDDIDTDRIIPARFLKAVTFEGLGDHVFEDDRREQAAAGAVHPFDAPASAGARVLIVGANFGCGSSREHAPRAIAQHGIQAIVGRSFAEIFVNNALLIGLACVTASDTGIARITEQAAEGAEVAVDLEARIVSAGGVTEPAGIADGARAALLSGAWDGTSLLLERYDEVERVRSRLPYLNGF